MPTVDCLAARVTRGLERQQRAVDVAVVLLLAAVQIESLREISLVVVEADADERNAEIRRRLDVIARENAETARINRNGFVQPELGREIRDRARPQHARVPRAPRARRRQVLLHAAIRVVDAAVQHERRRALFEPRDRNLPKQGDRDCDRARATAPDRARETGSPCRDPSSTTYCARAPRAADARARRIVRACAPGSRSTRAAFRPS